ncbi:MAG: tetrapyrrole methylase, partial [Candidatus Electrothrix sp. AR5]|nr:tetrapyrrole methylase [Candidatus Electrothrix sp. AR5]
MWRTTKTKNTRGIFLLTALLWTAAFITCNATAAESHTQAGSFKVVGVGPGDGDLLTLRAVQAIQDAEVVFASTRKKESLSSVVDFTGKEVINGYGVLFWHYGKECGKNEAKHFKQRLTCEEYHARQAAFAGLVRNAVAQGKDVVMLSSGDPT